MTYAKVENGEVVREGFPRDFSIGDNAVTNPELLPAATLQTLGYLPITEDIPAFDPETQRVVFGSYEVLANSVVKHFAAEDYTPAPSIDKLAVTVNDLLVATMMLSLE